MQNEPFLSVVTPVYNGGPFLAQCINSILIQDYPFREYIIVNNCSTDDTMQIAEQFARLDSRIRVVTNPAFVGLIENHNNAFNQISTQSEYCKMVSADDYLLPGALTKLVRLAAAHRNIGIVGSYQQVIGSPAAISYFLRRNEVIRWKGLPVGQTVFNGRDVCRNSLTGRLSVFGTPTSSLYRSDLIRRSEFFFACSDAEQADIGCCYAHLRDCDYGFVQEILSTERQHTNQVTTNLRNLNAFEWAAIEMLIRYGPLYFTETECIERLKELLTAYYHMLAGCVFQKAGTDFWRYHKTRLQQSGYELNKLRVLREVIRQFPSRLLRKIYTLINAK
jgi:glycosyltransferase involved in cell wall biosynthesis